MSFETRKSAAAPRRRRHLGGLIALLALAVAAAVWVWTVYLASVSVALLSWQNGVIAGGATVFCAGLLAELRLLNLDDVLDWIWAGIAAIGAIIAAIFWGILALIGIE